MHAIILPLLVQSFVGPDQKSGFLGFLTFTGLVIAIIVQPVAGTASDRSASRWGRRRPFVLTGITAALILLAGIGLARDYFSLFVLWCLMQASLNLAQGPYQGLIPDLVPEEKWGQASGIKNLLEIAGGVALLRIFGSLMANYHSPADGRWLWLSLGILGLTLAATLIVTLLLVKERPSTGLPPLRRASLLVNTFKINVRANSGFLLFLASRLLFIMGLTTLQSFALYYFQDIVPALNPVKITADLVTVVGIVMLLVVYPAGRLSDRIGRKPLLIASGFLAAPGIALIFFFPVYGVIIFAGCLIGLAAGAFLSTSWALAIDLVPGGESARYLGLTNLAGAGGGALARLIGPLIDFFNRYGYGLGYLVMLAACFIYFITASILVLKVRAPGRGLPGTG